ncbi:MAG: hypothetical protein ACI4VE_03615 [Clostridia bacterium]
MSKKKVTLEEAKEILGSDKIFYNGNRKFNVVDSGKYHSGITIEIPQEWTIDKRRKPESPISYISAKELTDGMNIDFDGDASILLGRYRLSKNGRPVFELTEPTKARDTLIRVSWGGAFNRTRGQYEDYAKEVGASFFTRRSSNGGGAGNDYWILPVDFVRDMEPRDVSAILANIEHKENERVTEIDEYIEQEDLEIKNSTENRDRILGQIEPIIQSIQTFNPEFEYTAGTDSFTYKEKRYWSSKTRRYTDELTSEIAGLLEKAQNEKNARDTYMPMFKEMESTLNALGISLNYNNTNVTVKASTSYFSYKSYNYSQEGFNSFISDVTQYQEKLAQEQEEARRKAEELKKAAELKRRKDEAKEMGYPEEFEFWNRLGGATNLGHAYVIESDGTIREPDYNNLRNSNHRYKYSDWKNYADGTQGYVQILPGEIIVTYTKGYTAVPYIFDVEWADGEITEAQLEVICNELAGKATFAEDRKGQEITDVKQWVVSAVKAKAEECKKQLILKKDNDFAEEIVGLAEEKATAQDRNTQAAQLTQAYEEQLEAKSDQQSLEDD